MFDIGIQELIIIFVVALLVIGPDKLPAFSRTLGKWVAEIKKGIHIAKSQMEAEMKEEFKLPEDVVPLPKEDSPREEPGSKNEAEGKA